MRTRLCVLTLLFLLHATACLADTAGVGVDVRVLIDISGSMRKNDPNNLRRPALRMLVGLLQPGTYAGVWTFGRWVNMLVPHGRVDAAWKQKALTLSNQIGSPGQFTNIEEVLSRAAEAGNKAAQVNGRHLVLLTDGMVDIAKQPQVNAASRARILNELLPAIKASGTKIHALALSDRADHELLQRLAAETDGWYQKVESADELQRAFLRIFEKVGKPDGVPLKGNRFQVDKSIREATVLVFRGKAAAPVRLHAPDGSTYEGSDIPAGIAWQKDQGYDLMTISDPLAGEWWLEANEDPDNRVMIITDLKLETSELPNRMALGEEIPFTAYLTNKGKLIGRRAFLRLVDVVAQVTRERAQGPLPINDRGEGADQVAADGQYSVAIKANPPAGPVSLVVTAESDTFVREKHFQIDTVVPAVLTIETEAPPTRAKLGVNQQLMTKVSAVRLWQVQTDNAVLKLNAEPTPEGDWTAPLVDPALPVMASLEVSTRSANPLRVGLGPVYPPDVAPPAIIPPEPEPIAETAEPSAPPEPPKPPEPSVVTVPDEPPAVVDESDWIMPVTLFGGFNLLLALAGGAWWYWRRRRGGTEEFVLAKEEQPEAPAQGDATTDISRG